MRRIIKDFKFLIPPAKFVIDFAHQELYEVEPLLVNGEANWVCWSMNVYDWEPFKKILDGEYYGLVDLGLDLGGSDGKQLIFRREEISSPFIYAKEVIGHDKRIIKEEFSMAVVERPLTPEEKIEQLEKEKADLERMIKNQHEYEEMKKGTDSIALMLRAFEDSGMTREEAMDIIKVTIPASMMANSLPGSIFGRVKRP